MKYIDQRSSWPAAIAAGVLGWTAFTAAGLLAAGEVESLRPIGLVVLAGIVQTIVLRLLFYPLQMHRSLITGACWGLLCGALVYYFLLPYMPFMSDLPWMWMPLFLFIGTARGWYLTYFYQDDRRIEAEAADPHIVTYGRDSHWYEPFLFGAVMYTVCYLPIGPMYWVYPFLLGSMAGIVSAAASHFSPDRWKFSPGSLSLLILATGGISGMLTGLLFHAFQDALSMNYIVPGIVAGLATYLLTFLRGRQLAAREQLLPMR